MFHTSHILHLHLSWLQTDEVNIFYSTPSRYVDAIHQANLTWEVKTDDFFPYADCPWCYWTGYFTSRIALKGYVRKMNGLLQVMINFMMIMSSVAMVSRHVIN